MKLVEIENKLHELELEASKNFDKLLKRQSKINFYDNIDFDKTDVDMNNISQIVDRLDETGDIDVLPILEYRSDTTGHVKDVRPLYVSLTNGILVCEDENIRRTYYIKFSSIGHLSDRIRLLELMEECIVNP